MIIRDKVNRHEQMGMNLIALVWYSPSSEKI